MISKTTSQTSKSPWCHVILYQPNHLAEDLFRKRYIKLRVVLCASRQYIMSHVVIPPELLKGGGTFSSIFVVPPP